MASTRRLIAELPGDKPIPLTMAHAIVGRGRSTIYAWVDRGLLKPQPSPDGMTVTPDEVRAAEASITRGRPAARSAAKAGQSEIESPVD